jgi:hypothetical protein
MRDFSPKINWLLGYLAPVLTLNPKILGSMPKQLKKANKNFTVLPGNQKSAKIFYEIKKTPKHRCGNLNFDIAYFDRS